MNSSFMANDQAFGSAMFSGGQTLPLAKDSGIAANALGATGNDLAMHSTMILGDTAGLNGASAGSAGLDAAAADDAAASAAANAAGAAIPDTSSTGKWLVGTGVLALLYLLLRSK